MDDVLIKMLEQAPQLAVLVLLVVLFLRHLQAEGASTREIIRDQSNAIREQAAAITDLRVELADRE